MAASVSSEYGSDLFEYVFAQEFPRVVSVAYRIVGDLGEAEDVAQEIFVAFARRRLAGRAHAAAWLYRAAVHGALNSVRARKRRVQRELREHRLHQRVREADEHSGNPQVQGERNYDRRLVRAAFLRLRRIDAQLLALRYSDFSYREIAEILALNVQQIGTRLARAERALRKEIDHDTP